MMYGGYWRFFSLGGTKTDQLQLSEILYLPSQPATEKIRVNKYHMLLDICTTRSIKAPRLRLGKHESSASCEIKSIQH